MGNSSSGYANGLMPLAPGCDEFTSYDAQHMLTYARLLDAERAGQPWQDAAREILLLNVKMDLDAAERCWRSHLDRAIWSVSLEGLAAAAASDLWEQPPAPSRGAGKP